MPTLFYTRIQAEKEANYLKNKGFNVEVIKTDQHKPFKYKIVGHGRKNKTWVDSHTKKVGKKTIRVKGHYRKI